MRSDNNNGYYSTDDFERDLYGEKQGDDRARALGIYDEYEQEGRRSAKKKARKAAKGKGGGDGKPPKKRNKKKTALIIISCFIILVAALFALGYAFLHSKLSEVNRVEVSDEDWDIDPQVAEDLKDYKNILLVGIDAREGEDPETCRTDGIIIMTINKKTDEITLTSVMRDAYLDLEENDIDVLDKVTHAHVYGGPVNTARALNRNLDLNIDDFVRVDWSSVADIANAMGGLEVDVSDTEIDEVNKFIADTNENLDEDQQDASLVEKTGKQTLDGVQIVSYCRIRKTDGDEQRTERMREVISSAFEKAKTLKLSQLNDVADIAMSEVTTSMSTSTMMDLLTGMTSYEMSTGSAFPYEWNGGMINSISYDVPITLKSNVVQLHEEVFGQTDYQPTDRVLEINEEIKAQSGYYGDEQMDYNYYQIDIFKNGGYSTDYSTDGYSTDGTTNY